MKNIPLIKKIYHHLFKHYGRQGWWPVTPAGGTHPCYCGGPRNENQIFEVMAGAILTQNTAWLNVEKALHAMQRRDLLSVSALLAVNDRALAEAIRSSGYFNQKTIKLKNLARFLEEWPIAKLQRQTTTKVRELLLSVKGIGPETADSIVLYGLGKPLFVIDAYTKRIFSRVGLCKPDVSYGALQQLFHDNLTKSVSCYNEYHALLVKHGKEVCRKKPRCPECVLRTLCKTGRRGLVRDK